MLSTHLLRSLGITESDAPLLDLERDWGITENPDSTPTNPSCCVQGELVLRPWAEREQERVQWVHDPKQRPHILGDLFVRHATQTKMTPKECILQCGSNEECKNSGPNPDDETGRSQVPLPADEWRAYTVVIADDPLSAIAAHSLLAAYARRRTPEGKAVHDYMHFCFLASPTRFDKAMRQLQRVTVNQIVAPGTDYKACQRAFSICNRHSSVLFLSMPELPGVTTLYDFVTRYELTPDERIKWQGSKSSMMFNIMAGAISIDPFKRSATIDKKTGDEKDYNFQLQIRSAWLLMQSRGYVRVIDPTQPDKVGRYYKVTGNIVDEVNRESLMARCTEVLTEYARNKARFGTPDFEKMAQAIRTAKTLSVATAIDLPVIALDRRHGYGRHLDHFFFRNGALRITPTEIRLIPYDELEFFVDASAILPWDYIAPADTQPFRLYENPEYQQRKQAIDDAQHGPDRISPREHARRQRDLYDWARLNRWVFQPATSDWSQWSPFMKVIRCYANEDWEEEQELEYQGRTFDAEQQQFLTGRIVNILATIGRIVFRYRGVNFLHYIMENNVSAEGKAEGGSGKSFLINDFVACVRNVLQVDSKKLNARDDIETSVIFNAFRPGYHDIVHVEDYERDIKRFYNYVTGNFEFRKFHTNETRIESDEAPSIVITSNYAVRDGIDDSSAGRLNLCGISHFFHRENENLNLMQRGFDVVMPDFAKKAAELTDADRSDIILTCALAVQFVMGIQDKVLAPAKNLKERNLRTALTDSFYEWASDFFSHPYNLGVPIDFNSIFDDYREISQASDDKQNKFSPKAFTDRIRTYCQANDIAFMPDVVYKTETDRRRKCLNLRCWVTTRYFDDERIWGKTRKKVIREMESSRKVICFYPADRVPATYDDVLRDFTIFWQTPDPEPYLDEYGQPVTLTPEERNEWNQYMDSKQGKPKGYSQQITGITDPTFIASQQGQGLQAPLTSPQGGMTGYPATVPGASAPGYTNGGTFPQQPHPMFDPPEPGLPF